MSQELPAVSGRSLNRSIADFERSCLVLLGDEQQKPNPDNALVAVLCDAVRLGRELSDTIIDGVKGPGERRAADRLAGEVCKLIDYEMKLDPRSAAGDALLDYASVRHGDRDPIGDVRRVFNALPTTKEGRHFPEISQYHARVAYLETVLAYISEGRGARDRDPLVHADNCIAEMKSVAVGAIAGTWTKED